MAKGNFILGQVTGSVGDIVFWRTGGEQLSRARNRRPANPRTTSQLISRVYLKTASLAYSLLAYNFGNQTFQGAKIGAENQRRFMSRNVNMLRQRVAQGEQGDMNFAQRGTTMAPLNRYVVSEGSLTDPLAIIDNNKVELGHPIAAAGSIPTYAEVCAGLGLPAGAQLTFVTVGQTDTGLMGSVYRSRIILSPSDGNMESPFISGGSINKPNPKNEYSTVTDAVTFTSDKLQFAIFGSMMAVACVASSNEDGNWRYSTSEIWFNQTVYPGQLSLEDAVESWRTEVESTEYTRQAGEDSGDWLIQSAAYTHVSEDLQSGNSSTSDGELSGMVSDEVSLECAYSVNSLIVDLQGNNLDVNDITVQGVPSIVDIKKRYMYNKVGDPHKEIRISINTGSWLVEFPTTYPHTVTVKYADTVQHEFMFEEAE